MDDACFWKYTDATEMQKASVTEHTNANALSSKCKHIGSVWKTCWVVPLSSSATVLSNVWSHLQGVIAQNSQAILRWWLNNLTSVWELYEK